MNQPVPGLVIAGKYRLEKALASGGMGSVWVARHIELDADVAIKFIASAASSEARSRFQREAKAAARIKSPHIVHVQDYGVDGDIPYIVMELLQGEDLATRLKRQQRLTLEQALLLLLQTAKALRRTHDEGIVHRDLKPGNIFLVRGDDEEDLVKIVDFGIAKGTGPFISGETTKTGDVMGSPSYMSPEQVRGVKDIDGRSDLWSLGVILFRAVTGRLPFVSEVHSDLFVKIVTETPPPPSAIAPDLPAELDGFFEKALSKDRKGRFQSAREMVEAFARIARPSVLPTLATASLFGQASSSAAAASRDSIRPSSQSDAPPNTTAPPVNPRSEVFNRPSSQSDAPPNATALPVNPKTDAVVAASLAPASSDSSITSSTTIDASAFAPRSASRWKRVLASAVGLVAAGGLVLAVRASLMATGASSADFSSPAASSAETTLPEAAVIGAETGTPSPPPAPETAALGAPLEKDKDRGDASRASAQLAAFLPKVTGTMPAQPGMPAGAQPASQAPSASSASAGLAKAGPGPAATEPPRAQPSSGPLAPSAAPSATAATSPPPAQSAQKEDDKYGLGLPDSD